MEENKAQKTPIMLSFADKLKMTMEVSGWRQSEIATLLGVGQKSVSFWVRGIKNPGEYNGNNIDLVYQRVVSYMGHVKHFRHKKFTAKAFDAAAWEYRY